MSRRFPPVGDASTGPAAPGSQDDGACSLRPTNPALERRFDKLICMSTKDQILSATLHGEALLRAQRPELEPLMAELRELAAGRDDIRVECAWRLAFR